MNAKTLYAIVGIVIVSATILGIVIKIPLDNSGPSFESPFQKEHYDIQITGMKDVYLVGEQYEFSYIISGFGHECGSKTIYFPDENGDPITVRSSSSCVANTPMREFVFDIQKEHGTTFGHVSLKEPGHYTVAVEFERGSGIEPTTKGHQFFVAEKICNDISDAKKQAQCLLDSHDSCESAYLTTRFPESSGGMVSLSAFVASWSDCSIIVHTENSAGEDTPYNGIRSMCNDVSIKDHTLNFEGCNNAKYPPISLTSQNIQDCNHNSGEPDFECFIDSFENCHPASISITRNTIEGDPIFFSGLVVARDDSCLLDFTIDATQDRFGSEGVTHRVCSNVYMEDGMFAFECDDGGFGVPLR